MDRDFDEIDVDLDVSYEDSDYNDRVSVGVNQRVREEVKDNEICNVKLGLIIPHRELATGEAIKKLKSEFMQERTVKFLAEQFNEQEIKFNIVDVEVISEATATMLDDVIEDDYTINAIHYHPTTMSVAIDIGSYSTDFISMIGVDIINDSEKRLNLGVDDLLVEIMNKIEDKYDVPFESLDMDNIAASLRYSTVVCEKCGTIVSNNREDCKCGGAYVVKNNIVRIGKRGFDVTDIVEECTDKVAKRIVEYFSTYVRRIFRLRGVALNQLENITLSGGGAELFGDVLKTKLEDELGDLVTVRKSEKPVRKNVDGLAKLIYHNDRNRADVDAFVAVDVGCSAVKSKILDKDGNEVIRGIEIYSKIAEPVKMMSYSIRKVKPLAELHVSIASTKGGLGDGEFFVGQLASKGEGQVRQSNFVDKCEDRVFYTLAYTSIATLIARLNHKIKNNK